MTHAPVVQGAVPPGVVAHLLTWAVLLLTALLAGVPGVGVIPVGTAEGPLPPVVIDLNSDPWPRLMLIEGIGEVLARRIASRREGLGGFRCLEEVMALEGIPDPPLLRARRWLLPELSQENPLAASGSPSSW